MGGKSSGERKHEYRWTPGRIALGMVIVLSAATFIGVVVTREVGNIRQSMASDALYAELLRTTTEQHAAEFNLDNLAIDRDLITFGGPPKDGIPAITNPAVVPIADTERLRDDDRVVGLVVGGEARAYPLRMLTYHEAVNDDLGGVPVAIVYCPLCDSVTAVDRRLDGAVHEFGISGLLVNSNVLLFDRTDDSLWSQVGLTAISGPNAGRSLSHLPWEITTARAWRARHADSTVMAFDTGYDRSYESNPYPDYFQSQERLLFPIARRDDRLTLKTPVIGVKHGAVTRAYPVSTIRDTPEKLVEDSIAGGTIVMAADPDGESVRVIEAPPHAHTVHTFWFAWAAFHPETEIYGED